MLLREKVRRHLTMRAVTECGVGRPMYSLLMDDGTPGRGAVGYERQRLSSCVHEAWSAMPPGPFQRGLDGSLRKCSRIAGRSAVPWNGSEQDAMRRECLFPFRTLRFLLFAGGVSTCLCHVWKRAFRYSVLNIMAKCYNGLFRAGFAAIMEQYS